MSVDDVQAAISQAFTALQQAMRAAEEAASQASDAYGVASRAAHDSEHSDVQRALSVLKEAQAETQHIAKRLSGAADCITDYRRSL